MSSPAAAGTIVAARYRLDAPAPGMDGAFSATDVRLERGVMVRLFPVNAWSAAERGRFQRDVKTAAGLVHTNVAGVLDFGTDPGLQADFVVTEMLRGEQLAALLAQRGTPPFPFALRVLQEAAAGVAAGHHAGIVHGEIHPATLFLSRGEADRRVRVQVTGFGARSAAVLRSAAARYAAPEALRRGGELSAAGDVFSLGVVGLELLAGLPAQWGGLLAALVRGQPGQLPELAELRPDLPRALAEAVQQALAVDPLLRFADAAGLLEALSQVTVTQSARASVPSVPLPRAPETHLQEPAARDLAAPPAPTPPAERTPDIPDPVVRLAAPGWKVASHSDLGDHLYIPPALLSTTPGVQPPGPEAAAARPVPPVAPVSPAPREEPSAVSLAPPAPLDYARPTPAPAAVAVPAEEEVADATAAPGRAAPLPKVTAVAVRAADPSPLSAAPRAAARSPKRRSRFGATPAPRQSPVLVGGGAVALLVVAAVAFAATRADEPIAADSGAAIPAVQQRLTAPLAAASEPAGPVASAAEASAQRPAAAGDGAGAEESRREEARALEAQRARDEARRLEQQQRAQEAALPPPPVPAAPVMRQVAVPVASPVAPPAAQPERPAAAAAPPPAQPAEPRPADPVVDPSRIYGTGEVEGDPVLRNAAELAREAGRSIPMGENAGARVVLGFVVLETGRVDPSSITVVSSTAVRFNGPARRVVARARFQPATVAGRPVKVRTQLPLIFSAQ